MAAWKCYEWENSTYPEYLEIKCTPHQQRLYIRKLARHFKITEPSVTNKRGTWGYARVGAWYGCSIKIPFECSLGMVIHEFAHILTWERWNERGHGRKFKRELKRCYTFAKRWLPAKEPVRVGA